MSVVGLGFFIIFGALLVVALVYPMVTKTDQTQDW